MPIQDAIDALQQQLTEIMQADPRVRGPRPTSVVFDIGSEELTTGRIYNIQVDVRHPDPSAFDSLTQRNNALASARRLADYCKANQNDIGGYTWYKTDGMTITTTSESDAGGGVTASLLFSLVEEYPRG
ncbi:MAG: hypothetical protein OXQ29_17770 [Rhodospirillaceae bacterium]|nr:hypothetical protein [Rhodospirillaceae bacterium]